MESTFVQSESWSERPVVSPNCCRSPRDDRTSPLGVPSPRPGIDPSTKELSERWDFMDGQQRCQKIKLSIKSGDHHVWWQINFSDILIFSLIFEGIPENWGLLNQDRLLNWDSEHLRLFKWDSEVLNWDSEDLRLLNWESDVGYRIGISSTTNLPHAPF